VAEAGWAADVELLGPVTREQKIDLLQRVDVLSVPAVYGESFGLYLPEAWAAGLPVVQPRHGGFTELVEHTGGGVLYEPGDPEALAGALGALLDDPARRSSLGEKGRAAAAADFTRARMAERVEAALGRVLGSDPGEG